MCYQKQYSGFKVVINRETVLRKLKELKPYLEEKYGITEIGLFGSVVRNEHREDSDIDILINYDSKKMKSLFRYMELQEELEEVFGRKVDLVNKKTISPFLRKRILEEVEYV